MARTRRTAEQLKADQAKHGRKNTVISGISLRMEDIVLIDRLAAALGLSTRSEVIRMTLRVGAKALEQGGFIPVEEENER